MTNHKYRILRGDSLDRMRELEDGSVDAIVTDPPYGLAFMGAKWDTFGRDKQYGNDSMEVRRKKALDYATANKGAPRYGNGHGPGKLTAAEALAFQNAMTPIFKEAIRVAKPGAHLLCFGGTRTFHRMTCAIEDAGWEIRDCIMWVYGCLDEETEVLVDGEFVPYNKAKIGSLALGYDIERGTFSWQRIEDTYLYDYDDTAYAIQSDSTDQLVSRNHRCIVERGGVEQFALAELVALEREACVPVLEGLHGLLDRLPLPDERAGNEEQDLLAGVRAVPEQQGAQALRGAWGAKTTLARVTPVHYKGKMWCIKVATGAFVARRHGKIFITGNSGFPKSMDVAKAIDKSTGYVGEVIGERTVDVGMQGGHMHAGRKTQQQQQQVRALSDQAQEWDGWGTCLKPAWEPIIVARKPLDGTVAHNVLTWGVGALNIDGCRVPTYSDGPGTTPKSNVNGRRGSMAGAMDRVAYDGSRGRFPANLVHDGSQEVLELFPDSKGQQARVAGNEPSRTGDNGIYGHYGQRNEFVPRGDSGSAARFFYCAKASKKDRGEGNDHPTVKPNALMRWLVRLVCPQGGIVLDPFMGSGSTGVACMQEGMKFVGIDMDEHYCEIAEKRIGAEPDTVFAGALWASM